MIEARGLSRSFNARGTTIEALSGVDRDVAEGDRLRAPLGGLVLGIAAVALLGVAFSSASHAAALILKSEDALAPLLNGLVVPLLLSGILLPMSLATIGLAAAGVLLGVRTFQRQSA